MWKEKKLKIFQFGKIANDSQTIATSPTDGETKKIGEGDQRLQALDLTWNRAFLNKL